MAVKVFIDGAIHDPHKARISVFDRGFLYGDSVYEVMRTAGGHPVDFVPHIDRLHRSAGFLGLAMPPRADIEAAVTNTLTAAENEESYVRIVVTRGSGEIGLDIALADRPRLIVMVKPLSLPPAEAYQAGIRVCIVGVQRTPKRAVNPAVKSGNYLNNIMALREAQSRGADEAIMCDGDGRVAEGASSNLFVVRERGLWTPGSDTDILQGITRARVISLARSDDIPVHEGSLHPHDVHGADEAFITSSIRGVIPVQRILGDGDDTVMSAAPGPITSRIQALYTAFLADIARTSRFR